MNNDFSGNETVCIPWSREHKIYSDVIGDDFQIWVSLPKNYDAANVRYPVIYLMDGNIFHFLVTDTIRLLRLYDEIPECILVSVGYPDDERHMALRNRDYGPTPFEGEDSGNADKFILFLKEELFEYIDHHYATDSEDRCLMGDSISGLFVMYTLLTQPEMFKRYVAGSPSLYWDEGVIYDIEEAYALNSNKLMANVFMSVGALEAMFEPPAAKMYDNLLKMQSLLESRAYEGLTLTTQVFDNETHVSVIPATMSRGLRVVFGNQCKDRSSET